MRSSSLTSAGSVHKYSMNPSSTIQDFLMLCNSALSSYHDNWSPLNRNQEVESKFEEFFFGGHMLCFGIHWSLTADILWPCALGKYQDGVLCIPQFSSKHFFDHNHKFQRKILSDFPPISWINKGYHWKKKKEFCSSKSKCWKKVRKESKVQRFNIPEFLFEYEPVHSEY